MEVTGDLDKSSLNALLGAKAHWSRFFLKKSNGMQRTVETTSRQFHRGREQRVIAGGGHYTMFAWA